MCARICACSAIRSEHHYGPNKASEMAQRGTKRVRTAMAEDQEAQLFSPTKRVRSEPTREEEEEEDDDLDTSGSQDASQLCTQGEMIGMRNSEFVPLKEAEVGVIEKVMLVNFMCHRKLDIVFSPNVNFVLGRNGSGKSAIMTAIVVALGGKAASTQRGSSLKQFIRTGCSSAEVIVHLRNRGTEAYRHDMYGDSIVVERQIRADGASHYKIKGVRGNIVSNKKEELISILDHCNIQIDNPVSLLNQDTSRNFLHSSNPSSKYKLFMKATHLEQIAHDYEKAEEDQKLMKEGITRQEQMLREYEKRAKQLEEQVDTFRRLRDMEGKVQQLEMELQWALVIEIEKGIPPIERDIEKSRGRIPRNEAKLQGAKDEVTRAEEEVRSTNKELDTIVKEAAEVNKQRNDMHVEKRTRDKTIRDALNVLRGLKREIAEKVQEKKALERRREECIEMSQRDTRGEQEHRLQQLKELQEQVHKLEDRMKTAANDRRQFEHALNKNQQDINDNQGRVSSLDARIRDSEDQLRRLQSSRTDQLQAFGPWMRTLVESLQRNRNHFRKMPKGPVGSMIRLKDYKWSTATEQVLRGVLSCFIVDNPYDDAAFKRVASEVLRRGGHGRVDTIICSFQDEVYDVSRNKPRCSYPTVLDMVDVADPDVLNTLIDQCSVESILLIEKRAEASHVIEHQRIRGVKSAYTLDGDQILPNRHYSNKHGKMGIIRASVDEAISAEQGNLDMLKRELDQMKRRGNELRVQAVQNKRRLMEVRDWMMKREHEKNQLQTNIQELQSVEEEESQEDIATYDGEIQECGDHLAALEQQRGCKEEEVRSLKAEQQECGQRIQEFEAEVEKVTRKMEELQTRHNQVARNKQRAESHLKYFSDRVKEIRGDIANLEKQLEEQKQRAEEVAQIASEVCDRIDTQRTRKSIDAEISKLKRKLQQEEPRRAEAEAVQQEYVETMELFQKTTESIKKERMALLVRKHVLTSLIPRPPAFVTHSMKAVIEVLHRSLQDRISCYKGLQERIVARACIYFTHFLSQRDYDGKLRFNHEKERLEMQVKVDVHSGLSQSTKNTKSLSGGERSYTTVCFIMSLWEAMEAPFRCLDEFDVFMDMLNRRISMGLMLEHATEQPNRQFIFFTPQDMSAMGVKTGTNVKIFRLNEPERGQTTLD